MTETVTLAARGQDTATHGATDLATEMLCGKVRAMAWHLGTGMVPVALAGPVLGTGTLIGRDSDLARRFALVWATGTQDGKAQV